MNGFVNVAPQQVSDIDGSNTQLKSFDPEHANQYEFGLKTNLYKDIVSGAISYYDIVIKDRLMTDPNNNNNAIQGGEVQSKGILEMPNVQALHKLDVSDYYDGQLLCDHAERAYCFAMYGLRAS